MNKKNNDTIIAQATPHGIGGVGILRISGTKVIEIAHAILGKLPIPRYADYLCFYDVTGKVIDKGISIFFSSPYSFTGEDVLELHCHGGQVIINILCKRILAIDDNDIRIAKPGEFSERAFMNNKIDLLQAEAISDLINASNEYAVRLAMNSLQGVFSQKIHKLLKLLINFRTYIEAIIEFPEENITLSFNELKKKIHTIIVYLDKIYLKACQGNLSRDGFKVVIAGEPNAGKSSLFNMLSGRELAIVTDIAGTTRDVLYESMNIDGLLFNIVDTAGLRKTLDVIEKIGIYKGWQEIKNADHILYIVDSSLIKEKELTNIYSEFIVHLPKIIPITLIRNKIDLTNELMEIKKTNEYSIINMSIYNKKSINLLCNHLKNNMNFDFQIENGFLARNRHLYSLNKAKKHLKEACQQLMNNNYELLSEELRLSQNCLNEIVGEFTSEDLLKNIFSNFCIGK